MEVSARQRRAAPHGPARSEVYRRRSASEDEIKTRHRVAAAAADPSRPTRHAAKQNIFSAVEGAEPLFTPLTFPLGCTLDIERCGRGPRFHRPVANEAIKSLLPRFGRGG